MEHPFVHKFVCSTQSFISPLIMLFCFIYIDRYGFVKEVMDKYKVVLHSLSWLFVCLLIYFTATKAQPSNFYCFKALFEPGFSLERITNSTLHSHIPCMHKWVPVKYYVGKPFNIFNNYCKILVGMDLHPICGISFIYFFV